jgi:rubrerythrin
LSLLESNASVLYTALADRTDLDGAKASLHEVAADSQKRSMILRNVSQRLEEDNLKLESNKSAKEVQEVFAITDLLYQRIIAKDRFNLDMLLSFVDKLDVLEKTLSEKYLGLQLNAKDLRQKAKSTLSRVNLEHIENLLTDLLAEGEIHRNLLEKIKETVTTEMGATEGSDVRVDFAASSEVTA